MAKSKMMKIDQTAVSDASIVGLYLRVSTDKQREEGYSIDIQKERLSHYAQSLFPQMRYELYVDDGFSGGSLNRPAMQKLIYDVKSSKVSVVIVMKLDRLSRSQKDTLYLIEDVFLPHNATFVSMQESFNTATPFGRAVIGILSVFAQLERENIFERTRSGMQKRVENGYWPGGGRIPFGYDYDKQQGILIPNKDADTVRRIYDLYIMGNSLQSIADMCGLKYEKLAYQIITRKSNAGYIVYNDKEYKGRHEPIIPIEVYDKAMILMIERSTKKFVSATDHLLTGLVYCGKCGAKMRYQKWGQAGFKFVCYSQQTSKAYLIKDPNCDNTKPWADEIEDLVISNLFAMSKKEVEAHEPTVYTMSPLEALQSQYDALAKKLSRLYDLYANDANDILLDSISDVRKQIGAIESKMKLENERNAWQTYLEDAKEKLKSVENLWCYMTIQEKQNVLRSVINKITVSGDHVHIDYKM